MNAAQNTERSARRGFQTLAWCLLIAVGVGSAIYAETHWHKQRSAEPDLKPGDWVYFFAREREETDKSPAKIGPGTHFVKLNHDEPEWSYVGRPGQFKDFTKNGDSCQVAYQLGPDDETHLLEVPRAALMHCPPEQKGYPDPSSGVIRAWNGTKATPLGQQVDHDGHLGDKVTVEVKDFDRWLFEQLDFGRLKDDLADLPTDLKPFVEKAVNARRAVQLFVAMKRINHLLRVEMTKDDEARKRKAWRELQAVIEKDPLLSQIKETIKPPVEWPAADRSLSESSLAELNLAAKFLPLQTWTYTLIERRFRQLTLTLNGVVLTGLTSLNALNDTEVTHVVRPSFQEDTYYWITFDLARQTDDGSEGAERSVAAANVAAWSRLLGRPRLREPMKVTLSLPAEGLELKTKVTRDAEEPCRFYLIGIRQAVFWATLAVFLCILGFLGWLARTTDILRDSTGHVRPDGIEPVSLAKTQMAFWFILTASAFAFLWVTTHNIDTINKTCLVLLGIGTSTALGAAFIPPPKERTEGRNYLVVTSLEWTRQEIAAEITSAIVDRLRQWWKETSGVAPRPQIVSLLRRLLSKERFASLAAELEIDPNAPGVEVENVSRAIKELLSVPGTTEANERTQGLLRELELLRRQREDFYAMPKTVWGRLFADWLNESPGAKSYQFHRFQMLAWTLLLGLVFLANLLNDRAMPEFGDMTLALLGISGGTYIGFKLPAALAAAKAKEEGAGTEK